MTAYDDLVKMVAAPTDDCLVWPHCKLSSGYGQLKVDGRRHHAHRLALQLTKPAPVGKVCSVNGDWVPGHKLEAAHGPCHNRLCCNPLHLSWKTAAENAADKKRDGTHLANEDHGRCKIPNADVARSRELYKGPQHPRRPKTGPTLLELAKEFGCSSQQIRHIVNGHRKTLPVNAQPCEELQQV